jgi:S1-C subfamily serine protease
MRALAAALGTSWVLLFGLACNVRAFIVDPTTENPPAVAAPPQSLSDYMETGGMDSGGEPLEVQPLGIMVRDDTGNLDDRAGVRGAAVVRVSVQGASAGILDDHHASHMVATGVLIGAGLAAAVLFPPAIMAVAILASERHNAESCDLIIAVDGTRVRNTLELVDAVQDIRTGDAVYLTIVRQRQRKQVVVHVR